MQACKGKTQKLHLVKIKEQPSQLMEYDVVRVISLTEKQNEQKQLIRGFAARYVAKICTGWIIT